MKEVCFKEGSKGDLACGRWEVIQTIRGRQHGKKEVKLGVGERHERKGRVRGALEKSSVPFHINLIKCIFIA